MRSRLSTARARSGAGRVVDGADFLNEKRVQGSFMGSTRFPVDMPRYVDFYMRGLLKLRPAQRRVLMELGFAVAGEGAVVKVTVPAWRPDIHGKAEWPAAEALYKAHPKKPFAIGEWGLWGIDDPSFVSAMASFLSGLQRTPCRCARCAGARKRGRAGRSKAAE